MEAGGARLLDQVGGERAADADLHRGGGVDQPLLDGDAEGSAVMVRTAGRPWPEVRVRVEVHERHLAVALSQRAQDGKRRPVIAAEDDRYHARPDDTLELAGEVVHRLLNVAGEDVEIAVVDDAELVERRFDLVRLPAVWPQLTGGVADAAGAEAGAGAIEHGHVHRHADDGDVSAREVAAGGATGEGVGTAIAWPTLPFVREETIAAHAAMIAAPPGNEKGRARGPAFAAVRWS